jgi:hypothetical protein
MAGAGKMLRVFWILAFSAFAGQEESAARRVLAAKCWTCHATTAAGGLRLDSKSAMLRGAKNGPVLDVFNWESSRLWKAIQHESGVKPMPPGPALSAEDKNALRDWLRADAPWTDDARHWSFAPLAKLPTATSIDSILERIQNRETLTPNPRADTRTLLRRISFDLTGLPPDNPNEPYNQALERLLASPHFGEKWGRHWLDVARYGEDDFSGTAVQPYPNAWRYRDWVVEALNRDMPYDKFLKAQIAGDLMNDPKLLPATGLFGLGPWYYGIAQPPQSRADERNDRVDMVSRGMLGVTLACARCHDHKYDPFSIKDYYALAGVFASTAYKEYPLVEANVVDDWNRRKKAKDEAEKKRNGFIDEQQKLLAEEFAHSIARYMLATQDSQAARGLEPKVIERWKKYLEKPEEFHPFLQKWFAGSKTQTAAEEFQALIVSVIAEKKAVDAENKLVIEAGRKAEAKPTRTIVLPGGYRSEEDFNPGAYIPIKSIERDRYVAWNRTLNEKNAPLKFDRDLVAALLKGGAKAKLRTLEADYEAKKKSLPNQYPFLAGAADFEPYDLQVHLRGNPETLGDIVPRRFPLALSDSKELPLTQGSGRLQLAEAVAHHPLAARVAVNRIWMALFGEGLVRTPSNFGKVGDRPALPELLDYLAARFAQNGYSTKALIREIAQSQAYQRSSATQAANAAKDPSNRYLWRQSRRRLEAEPLRDAMLSVSGELDRKLGGPSQPLDAKFLRRTLYAKTSRFQQDETLSLFDLPAAAVTCEQRVVTNVPLQKLYFLNSDQVALRAAALAKRIQKRDKSSAVAQAYRLLFQREPSDAESQAALGFLSKGTWPQYAQVLLSSNEFAYVD